MTTPTLKKIEAEDLALMVRTGRACCCDTDVQSAAAEALESRATIASLAADNNILVSALAAAHLAIASTDPALARRLTADERVGAFVAVAAAERAVARAAVAFLAADSLAEADDAIEAMRAAAATLAATEKKQ